MGPARHNFPPIPQALSALLRLTVLGSSAVRPNAGDACAGYVLESGDHRYLIDCGPGVAGRLLDTFDLASIDAVLLSHGHPDHCSDLVFLRQALCYAPDAGKPADHALPLYACQPAIETIEALGAVFSDGGPFWSPRVALHPIDPARPLELPGVKITFAATEHYIPCLAMRFEAEGSTIVYGADSGPSEALELLSRGADLLILESTLPRREGFEGQFGHLSAHEAGALAARSGARRLVITHYFDFYDPEALRSAAAAECDIPVEVAAYGRSWDV